MTSFIVILVSTALVSALYFIFKRNLKKSKNFKEYINGHFWLHPNAISIGRAFIGLLGFIVYWRANMAIGVMIGIFIFTIAAFLDAVDGDIAKACDKITELGKFLDPLCDKIAYLVPMFLFAYEEIISVFLVIILAIVEFIGQFVVRYILRKNKLSVAANNYGKIKAVVCFGLVIFCAIIRDGLFNNTFIIIAYCFLISCIILSIISAMTKLPFKWYKNVYKNTVLKYQTALIKIQSLI